MEHGHGDWAMSDGHRSRIEYAMAVGAIGGLLGLMAGPVATLVCATMAAGIGYVASKRGTDRTAEAARREGPRAPGKH